MKIHILNFGFCMNYKYKTRQEHARQKYILCQGVWRMTLNRHRPPKKEERKKKKKRKEKKEKKKKKKEEEEKDQGGLVGAWNAFLLNVFTLMGYLRWWGKLFDAKEPEKEKLVLKIWILVLGKSCLFPWTWRHSEGIMRSFRYMGLWGEQPFALKHICWVIAVCVEAVVWEHSIFDWCPY